MTPEKRRRCAAFAAGLKRMRMSMAEVARQAGVNERTVSRWVHGEVPVPGPMWALFRRWMVECGGLLDELPVIQVPLVGKFGEHEIVDDEEGPPPTP